VKVVLYVKCHRPEDGEMRLCLDSEVKSAEIAEAIIAREKVRYKDEPEMAERRRYEIED
jgi:hypothetical protein